MVVVPSVPTVPLAVPLAKDLSAKGLSAPDLANVTNLLPATNLSGILNKQGLENQLKGTVGSQMQDAAKQLGSLQENAVSQLQGLENQFKDASKIGESLGSQFKDASKIGDSLGSLLKMGGKRKKVTRKSSSRAFRKTRRRRQIYR